jgi:hypothetical protein
MLKETKVELYTYGPRQQRAYRMVIRHLHRSVQQELVREDIERMGHKIMNLCNISHRVIGNSLSPFLDTEQAAIRVKCTCNTQNIYKITESKLSHLTKSKIICVYYKGKRREAHFQTNGYCPHIPRCVKYGKSDNTEQYTSSNMPTLRRIACG